MKKLQFLYFIIALSSSVFGQVGINTTNPTETLHVEGSFRLVDGTQGQDHVLTSDNNGVATWQLSRLNIIEGTIGTGVNIPSTTTQLLQTGSNITLPPGRYLVNVNFLLTPTSGGYTPSNSNFWLRTSFSDSPNANPAVSGDLVGGQLISAGLPGSAQYQPLIGAVIINNTSGADKTYYYVAGAVQTRFTTNTLSLYGGSFWDERVIYALPIR